MVTKEEAPAPLGEAGEPPEKPPDPSLEDLRQILMRHQIEKVQGLEADLDRLEHQISDEGALVRMIAPVLGNAIRLKIREARDEMIEALYPIIGKVVQRAVTEAVSDLARSLDAQVKSSFDVRLAWWRIRARLSGASEAHIRLRELLPFTVTDILLIHRETGLLLFHLPSETSTASDTDLFSGMLTAIRDFAQDTLGGDDRVGLGEITHGDQSILIEAAQHAYLAVIVSGIAPPEFRAEMRERIIEIEHSHAEELRSYQGHAQSMLSVKDTLRPLMTTVSPRSLSADQKRFLAAALGVFFLSLVSCSLFLYWVWQLARQAPAPQIIIYQPAATHTAIPSATASPTSTPTSAPTATQTFTPLPPTPVLGVMLGNVWMHSGPWPDSPRLGVSLTLGEQVELLALDGEWVRVRRLAADHQVTGWIPARWLGLTTSIPVELITPSVVP